MASTAHFTLDPAFSVGEVDARLFGSFVEHLGRCVYTGCTSRATRPPTPQACGAMCSLS